MSRTLKHYDDFKNVNINRVWKPIIDSCLLKNKQDSFGNKLSNSKSEKSMLLDGFTNLLRDIGRGTFRQGLRNDIKVRGRTYYPIYSLISTNFSILLRYKRVKIAELYKHFNINKTNRIVGFTPDFVGASRSTYVKSRNYITEFISDNFSNIVSKVSRSCKRDLVDSINNPRVVYSAGYDTCSAHLREYFKDNTTEESLNRDKIIEILKFSNFKWFVAPVCDFNFGKEIFDYVRANLDSYPGHYSEKIFGKTKLFGDTLSRNVAYKLWTKMHKSPIKNLYLWKILGREKDIKLEANKDVIKEVGTRVVMTCESPITYFLMWIAQKFNYILGYADWDRTFNVCGEFNAEKSNKLFERSLDYDYILEADWSYYDSNIDTHFLEVGAALLCNGLHESKLHKNIITSFIMSVVTKYVILPPGVVVELNRSQPSGHPAGTLINCYVNLMYWCIIGYKIYGENYADNMHVEVYGDDTRAYFKHHDNLVYIDDYIAEVGLKSDKVINNIRSTKFRTDKCFDIDFLKRRFDESTFEWNHKKMFDKWLYQSKNRTLNDQIAVVVSYLESVPTDQDLKIITKMFINWVYDNFADEVTRETRQLIIAAERLIDDDIERVKEFKHEFGNKFKFKQFDEQMSLHSFGVERQKLVWINEKFTINYSVAKHLILYSLGLSYDQLANVDINEFLGVNRPPPLFVACPEYELNRYRKLLLREHVRCMSKLRRLM